MPSKLFDELIRIRDQGRAPKGPPPLAGSGGSYSHPPGSQGLPGTEGGSHYTPAPGVQGDPAGQIGSLGLMGKQYSIAPGEVDAFTREPTEQEMSAYHLEQMLGSNSPLMRRAAAIGQARAGARGLMNSSLAVGSAQGVMIDRAQPFALSDADAHRAAASESLQAENQARQTTAQLLTQANLAEAELGGRLDQIGLQGQVQGVLDESQRRWQTGERQDSQGWQTGERLGSQDFTAGENALNRDWQTGERLGAQDFTAGENALNRDWTSEENMHERMYNWAVAQLDSFTRMNMTQDSAMAQVMASIYSNPELSAPEQNAAWANAQQAFRDLYGREYEPPGYVGDLDPFAQAPGGPIEEPPLGASPPPGAPPPSGASPPPGAPPPQGSTPPLMGPSTGGGSKIAPMQLHGGYVSLTSPRAQEITRGLPPV